jgi:hypothetical protein
MCTADPLRKMLTIVVTLVMLSASLPEYAAEIVLADKNGGSDTLKQFDDRDAPLRLQRCTSLYVGEKQGC